VDPAKPNTARMYDYWPGGSDKAVAAFTRAMAPGSYVIISVGYDGELPPGRDFADTYNAQQGPRVYRRSHRPR
jgi:hypothetical protein